MLRTSRHITQLELASSIGVSKQSVSNWENNNILPSADVLRKLAGYFGCSTDYLLELPESTFDIRTSDLTAKQAALVENIVNEFKDLNEMSDDPSEKK